MAPRELILRATERFDGSRAVVITGADREEDLADVDAGDGAVGFAPSPAHARLQAIGAGTREHFVDADDVIRVGANAEVEAFFASDFDEVPEKG